MTLPAVAEVDLQSNLRLCVDLAHVQSYITEPTDETLCTEPITLNTKTFYTADPIIKAILSCDGRSLAGEEYTRWSGAFTADFVANSRHLGFIFALGYGDVTSPSSVGAASAVWTETVTATGGTRRIEFDGYPVTDPIAYNANAAAIQTAVNAAIGAGKVTVAGTGPYTYTAAGSWANSKLRKPTVSTLKLTGGTSTIAETTIGGAARSSYTVTQSDDDNAMAITAVLGYDGGEAHRLQDLALDTFDIARQADGTYLVRTSWIWKGIASILDDFDWPECSSPDDLEDRDSRLVLNGTDYTDGWEAFTYSFAQRIDRNRGYTNTSRYLQRMIRQFPLPHEMRVGRKELAGGALSTLIRAGGQEGTALTSFSARLGHSADGVTLSGTEGKARWAGTPYEFDNGLSQVPALIRAYNSDSDPGKPLTATIVTDYADGYLDPA